MQSNEEIMSVIKQSGMCMYQESTVGTGDVPPQLIARDHAALGLSRAAAGVDDLFHVSSDENRWCRQEKWLILAKPYPA